MPKVKKELILAVFLIVIGAGLLPASLAGGYITGPGGCTIGGVAGINPSTTSVQSGSPITFSGKIQSSCNYAGSIVNIWTSFSNGLLNSPVGSTLNQVAVSSSNTFIWNTVAPSSGGTWYIAAQLWNCPAPGSIPPSQAALCSYVSTVVTVNLAAPKTQFVQVQYSGQNVGTYLAGVIATITNNGATVATSTSNSNGVVTFNLPNGNYQILSLPGSSVNYALQSDSRSFLVNNAPVALAITLQQVPIQAVHYAQFIQLRTNATGTWQGIPGATFQVSNGSQTIFTGTSDATGAVEIVGLNNGSYSFTYQLATGGSGTGTFTVTGYPIGSPNVPVLVISLVVYTPPSHTTTTATSTNALTPQVNPTQAGTAILGFVLMIAGVFIAIRYRR